ncbi:serine peptidase [Streptomyces sp. NPDC007991]|uniref:serine peptidase n=1 Tax=Streptomyces sp. NPDC007991 TaxID=3364803 RepID=UPI0036E91ED7
MTRVLGIHGVRNYKAADTTPDIGSKRLRTDWTAALGSSVPGLDLETAYYADLLRSERQGDELADVETVLVEGWARAWGVDPSGVQGRATGWLRWICGQVAQRSGQRPAVVEKTVRAFFPEVARYFATGRAAVRERVTAALLRHRPDVVVAHSLGSVVAYEALHGLADELEVRLLLTLGSPLALPHAVFHRLDPAPRDGVGSKPDGVLRWVNVADVGDFVAIPKGELTRVFPEVEELPEISIAPAWPHSVLDYLRHRSVSEAIRAGAPTGRHAAGSGSGRSAKE